MKKYSFNKINFLFSKIIRRIPINNTIKIKFNKYRHERIEKTLAPYFKLAFEKTVRETSDDKCLKNEGPIWVFWWQGEKKMPALVKKCYLSLLKNRRKKNVVLITKDNYEEYTDISTHIINLLKEDKITLTHFSDILRFNLLKNHGGLWLDATIFVNKPINDKYFSPIFTCCGFPDKDYFFITKGKWCGFLIGGAKNNSLFRFMDTFFNEYWKDNINLIDYFLIDYALNFAWQYDLGSFQTFTKRNMYKDNVHLFDLADHLNSKFNNNTWKELTKNTEMYKLTYKMTLSNRENTFYNRIVKGGGKK